MDDQNKRDKNEDVILGNEATPESEKDNKDSGQARMTNDDSVEQELGQLKNLVSQLDSNYKRALADYQNLQRRTQEEKTQWIITANKGLVLKLLEVLDTLTLAQKHIKDKGLDLSIEKFDKVLESEGVKKIETIGREYDPNLMEAISTKEVDKKDKGKVVEETRAGYIYNGNVLRAAQVIVGE